MSDPSPHTLLTVCNKCPSLPVSSPQLTPTVTIPSRALQHLPLFNSFHFCFPHLCFFGFLIFFSNMPFWLLALSKGPTFFFFLFRFPFFFFFFFFICGCASQLSHVRLGVCLCKEFGFCLGMSNGSAHDPFTMPKLAFGFKVPGEFFFFFKNSVKTGIP